MRRVPYHQSLFDLLDIPFFCFHDRDIAPEGNSLRESNKNVRVIADPFRGHDYRKYHGCSAVTPNRLEAGLATAGDDHVFQGHGDSFKSKRG